MKLHKLTCPNCKGTLDMTVTQNTTSVFCPYCGQKFYLDDEKKEYTINTNININKNVNKRYTDDADVIRAKNEAIKDSRDFKHVLILLGIIFIISVLPSLGLYLNDTIAQNKGKVSAGYYKDLIGKDYKTIESHFEAAGFINVELLDLNDAGMAFWNEGKVDTISIGGKTDFDSTDWFEPDTKVVISYH